MHRVMLLASSLTGKNMERSLHLGENREWSLVDRTAVAMQHAASAGSTYKTPCDAHGATSIGPRRTCDIRAHGVNIHSRLSLWQQPARGDI